MIGRLQGTILEKHPPSILIDVQGVGYELEASMSTFYHLPECGETIILHTHLVVKKMLSCYMDFIHCLSARCLET